MNKNILFITSTRIGDAVLSSGILSYLLKTYPDAKFTIACGPIAGSFFQGVPNLENLFILNKKTWNRHWIELWLFAAGKKWDIVVDLRNSAVSRLVLAKERHIFGSHIRKSLHKVSQNAAVIGVPVADAVPKLYFTQGQLQKAHILIPEGRPILAIGPTANWIGKVWPVENFQRLVDNLIVKGALFYGWRLAVFGAPNEEEIAYRLYDTLPEHLRINCIAKGSPAEAAACLSLCHFYIGNDSGLMHSAAATGVPTVGLFGPTNDLVYAPYGQNTLVIRTPETLNELTGAKDFDARLVTKSLMQSLDVHDVESKVRTFAETVLSVALRQQAG